MVRIVRFLLMAPEVFEVSSYPGCLEFKFCHIPWVECWHCALHLKYSVLQFLIVCNVRLWIVLYIHGYTRSYIERSWSPKQLVFECVISAALMFMLLRSHQQLTFLSFECFVGIIRYLFAQSCVLYVRYLLTVWVPVNLQFWQWRI